MDMKQMTAAQIRSLFIRFFEEKGHQLEKSAPLVPQDDPSLLWINSGVATLKKYFDGTIVPDNPRIVNAQKAIRTNDIENVGFTARHHTFFEMLGNFSIGEYFKEEAIVWAWEFLTDENWIGFDKDLLYVTVHPEDDEAYDIWVNKIGLQAERIIRLEENFWDIGEGPSGPNTEIFYDRGSAYGDNENNPELYPGGENERYLEIWNLVFSEFNHNADDSYTPLPNKNIDTGMGLERMASVIQDVPTNYDTDLFVPIIQAIEKSANTRYGTNELTDAAFKIIADHIRTVAFAVGDHALPSNEGRGYILRRLIRRAVRYAKNIGINEPFMYTLVPVVGDVMKAHYPEVYEQADHIMNIVQAEEKRFYETLNEGLSILTDIIHNKDKTDKVIPGEVVFKLYDTYGFPKELTEEYVAEHQMTIDEKGFEIEMEKQRSRARDARDRTDSMQVQSELLTKLDKPSTFVGYDQFELETSIVSLISGDAFVEEANIGDSVIVVLQETPFYAESGGQVADKGILKTETGSIHVENVQKAPRGQHIHYGEVVAGSVYQAEKVQATIDMDARKQIIKNHTATHILHQALKDVLGDHVHQAGSLVQAERLRFDFNHFSAISNETLEEIEKIVNEKIWESLPVEIAEMSIDEAKALGAMALFGEKYGDIVRVVQIDAYSKELCGGCHVLNSSEIGLFKIVAESGIGAGVRRIEAVTSKEAFLYMDKKLHTFETVVEHLKTSEDRVIEKVDTLHESIKALEKENESFVAKMAHQEVDQLLQKVQQIDDVNVLAEKVAAKDMNQLRNMVDEFKQKLNSSVILLAAESNGKVQFAAGITKDLVDRNLHAGNLIKQAAIICGGGGGGRPDMAQAGAKDPNKIPDALAIVPTYVTDELKK